MFLTALVVFEVIYNKFKVQKLVFLNGNIHVKDIFQNLERRCTVPPCFPIRATARLFDPAFKKIKKTLMVIEDINIEE